MLRKIPLLKRSATLVLLVFGLRLGAAWAQTESVLYSFCSQGGCADGREPIAGVVVDQQGNLYGTTQHGGAQGGGTVFQLNLEGQETVLYSFCVQPNCADGAFPQAGVALDPKGNLYGTTASGGALDGCGGLGCGSVFKLTPAGQETVLDSLAGYYGYTPVAGVVFDQKGNLYGTTLFGGDYQYQCRVNGSIGCGVVFGLTPKGKEIVLHSFCTQANCADGAEPSAGLVPDPQGNGYGTTLYGGAHGNGVVFKLTPDGKYRVLYSFCAQANCTDGAEPAAGVVLDQEGNLYGITSWGGAHGNGVVFKLTPTGKETVLYSFCAQANCADGSTPVAGLVLDQNRNLFGTTRIGGAYSNYWCSYGCGVVFRITPKGSETVLYSFCAQTNCIDGAEPQAGLAFDQQGNLYGTTSIGGAYDGGVVFKLTP